MVLHVAHHPLSRRNQITQIEAIKLDGLARPQLLFWANTGLAGNCSAIIRIDIDQRDITSDGWVKQYRAFIV
ncbi:hypothetical protein DBR23_23250 [Acidovorax sp. HMWF018]|nr:hypothetical protein DBR23_23250 [Acidovorax sp. HMWF018]